MVWRTTLDPRASIGALLGRWTLLGALILTLAGSWGAFPSPLLAQDGGGEEKPEDGESGEGESGEEELSEEEKAAREKAAEEARQLAERQSAIALLFNATTVAWEEETGRIILTYNFEDADHSIARDWVPEIPKFKKRVRWSRGWEGGAGIDRDTIVVSEHGTWLHKAQWSEVEVDVDFHMITEIMKKGDLIAAVYAWDKGRRMAGSNIGEQLVRLSGSQKHTGNPMPRAFPLMHSDERRTFGYKLRDGVIAATQKGRVNFDSSKSKNFLKKLKPGHAGFTWKGEYMKGYLISFTMKGTLDPKWLEKALAGD